MKLKGILLLELVKRNVFATAVNSFMEYVPAPKGFVSIFNNLLIQLQISLFRFCFWRAVQALSAREMVKRERGEGEKDGGGDKTDGERARSVGREIIAYWLFHV